MTMDMNYLHNFLSQKNDRTTSEEDNIQKEDNMLYFFSKTIKSKRRKTNKKANKRTNLSIWKTIKSWVIIYEKNLSLNSSSYRNMHSIITTILYEKHNHNKITKIINLHQYIPFPKESIDACFGAYETLSLSIQWIITTFIGKKKSKKTDNKNNVGRKRGKRLYSSW